YQCAMSLKRGSRLVFRALRNAISRSGVTQAGTGLSGLVRIGGAAARVGFEVQTQLAMTQAAKSTAQRPRSRRLMRLISPPDTARTPGRARSAGWGTRLWAHPLWHKQR